MVFWMQRRRNYAPTNYAQNFPNCKRNFLKCRQLIYAKLPKLYQLPNFGKICQNRSDASIFESLFVRLRLGVMMRCGSCNYFLFFRQIKVRSQLPWLLPDYSEQAATLQQTSCLLWELKSIQSVLHEFQLQYDGKLTALNLYRRLLVL